MGINRFCTEGIDSLGSKDVVISVHIHNIQLASGGNIGSDEDTVSGGTLCAVAGNGTHGEVLFANTLGDEGGRTAAVTVSSPLTAKSEHSFAQLVVVETNGVVCTTTVVHTNYKGTVFLNTNHRTGSRLTATGFRLGDQFAIHNGHGEGYADCVQQSAFCKILLNLSLIVSLNITRNISLCILKYIENRGCCVKNSSTSCYILMRITNPLTIVYKYTRGVRVVVKVCVHTADDIVSEVVLIILRHFGQFLMGPVGLIFQILVNLVVSRNDGYIGVRRVYFNDMKNLSTGTISVVQNHL